MKAKGDGMATSRGKPRPKAYLSIGEYLRKAGAFKTVNVYYNTLISTHPSVAMSENGDTEDVDELTQGMIEAAQHGHLETLRFLAEKVRTGGEDGEVGRCIGERAGCLMLHLAAEAGHEAIVRYLVEDLWVDVDEATVRGMTALHYAAKANRTAVIRELARLGADLEVKNDAGQVPVQLTKDRLLRRLFQQYLGGVSWGAGGGALVDRFVAPSSSRVVDYAAVMTVKLAPQLRADCDQLSDLRHASVAELCRFPVEDHEDTPMTDASNLAEICTQGCYAESGPLIPYGTLLTDSSGARSYVWSKILGVYQDAAQRGRARVHSALSPLPEGGGLQGGSVPAGEMSARVVLVLARHPFTAAYSSICEHIGELILVEASKWGSLPEWPLDMGHDRNQQIKFCMEHYASELALPLPSAQAEHTVLGRTLRYGDMHASHSSFPHLEESDLRCLTSRLGPDTILVVLSCLLQEQSVLLLSDRLEDLAPATSALLGLLFPLRWPHTLIPVLPASLVHYLEAPVPFLMGMPLKGLDRVAADMSCITMVNLTTNSVVLPIRPITSVSTVAPVDASGKEPQRRPSRRDSDLRSLAELPRALRRRAETRIRRCVPLEGSPVTDRVHIQPRASKLYSPGVRVAVADVMVDLFGAYQTYRYVLGSQKRMISEAPEDHRKLLQAIYSTQLWRIFRDDLLSEKAGANGENWEDQAQLFCACVERARHQGGAAGSGRESHSCQQVLYPSEDVEEQLALLSVYPEPTNDGGAATVTTTGGRDAADPASAAPSEDNYQGHAKAADSLGVTSAADTEGAVDTGGAGGGSLQEKTEEVLKSITHSFATVTDMFGGSLSGGKIMSNGAPGGNGDANGAGVGAGAAAAASQPPDRPGDVKTRNDGDSGGGGWDMFKKPPSMAEMKRRLEELAAGTTGGSPPSFAEAPQSGGGTPTKGRSSSLSVRRTNGGAVSPQKKQEDTAAAAAAAGLAKFGDGWRNFRRRSAEAVEEAVTKLKTALDDSDDEGAADARVSARIADKARARAAAAAAAEAKAGAGGGKTAAAGGEDDSFWRPFGDNAGDGSGDGGDGGGDGRPVPLPTAEEVRRGIAASGGRPRSAARMELEAYYGGGQSGGGGGVGGGYR